MCLFIFPIIFVPIHTVLCDTQSVFVQSLYSSVKRLKVNQDNMKLIYGGAIRIVFAFALD